MRILHLLDHSMPRRSDYSRRTLALLRGLRGQGVQTVHLTGPQQGADAGPAGTEPVPGWHFYRTAPPAMLEHAFPWAAPAARTVALALRLRQVARLTRPDLIHVHLPSWNALAALPAARLARLPLVVEAERRADAMPPTPGLRAWLERQALRSCQAVRADSAQVRARLRAEGSASGRIAVIPPPPDLPPCTQPACRREGLAPPGLEGAPLLLYAGSAAPEDGAGLMLAAFAALRRRHPALRLVLAGCADDGADRGADEMALARPLRGHVVRTGKLSYRRVADLLPRADIAVFPVLQAAGCLAPSRHLLNAMAQGCAIVASDIACHRELLVHGHSGMLFQAGSRAALVEVLVTLLDQPWRLAALGTAAAREVGRRHSWERTAARYRRLYESVLREQVRAFS